MTMIDDVSRCVTMDVKKAGNLILVVGETKNELAGGVYYRGKGELGSNVPRVDLAAGPKTVRAVAQAISQGFVKACHDCSEGGLAVALAEMAFAGGLGMEVNLGQVPCGRGVSRSDQVLFSESTSRFVIEIEPAAFGEFAAICKDVRFGEIGKVLEGGRLVVKDESSESVIDAEIDVLKESWQAPLRW